MVKTFVSKPDRKETDLFQNILLASIMNEKEEHTMFFGSSSAENYSELQKMAFAHARTLIGPNIMRVHYYGQMYFDCSELVIYLFIDAPDVSDTQYDSLERIMLENAPELSAYSFMCSRTSLHALRS